MRRICLTNGYIEYAIFRDYFHSDKVYCMVNLYFIAGKSNFAGIVISKYNSKLYDLPSVDIVRIFPKHDDYPEDVEIGIAHEFLEACLSEAKSRNSTLAVENMLHSGLASSERCFGIVTYVADAILDDFLCNKELSVESILEIINLKRPFKAMKNTEE